ncbi:MAG: hypothetical protein M3Y78_08345 [Pseudomonadota bacterium]|nr:hypothetical protein [Pseudomonadota bacterium]
MIARDRECRRKGACLAENNPPACSEQWSGGLRARFGDIVLGMEVTAFHHRQEDADFHAWACEQLGLAPDGKAPPGKRSRKAARLNTRAN